MAVKYQMTKISRGESLTPNLHNKYWIETADTVNDEAVYKDANRDYGLWHDGSKWVITVVDDIDGSPTNYFAEVVTDAYAGNGAWSGQIKMDSYTVSDGWRLAEDTCFDSLADFLGATEGVECFRGFLPTKADGELEFANVWRISSGGGASGFEIERTYGEGGNWCSVLVSGELEGVFETRDRAMRFGGSVMAWLKSTNNLHKQTNVTWCHLADLPQAPVLTVSGRHRVWRISVPLEILYLTESVHDTA